MNTHLRDFVVRFLAVVTITLVPVVFTAFASMPWSLQRHPGELALHADAAPRHMT